MESEALLTIGVRFNANIITKANHQWRFGGLCIFIGVSRRVGMMAPVNVSGVWWLLKEFLSFYLYI